MNILHVCRDIAYHKIYLELISNLDKRGISQIAYVPCRINENCQNLRNSQLQHCRYFYAPILKRRHRLFFRNKIKRIINDLESRNILNDVDLIHAHFLYSDGAVALYAKKRYKIPYVVAIRNTDINYFMKWRPDLRWLCRDILKEAESLIFLSPSYRNILLRKLPKRESANIAAKAIVIGNGISKYWINDEIPALSTESHVLKLLYVGEISRNKNTFKTIQTAARINQKREVKLTLVGAGGNAERKIQAVLDTGKYPFVRRLGKIDDREKLKSVYRDHHIFIMPSLHETFGVAYIEALSQGLPVIYSKGQGIDGYFENGLVGAAVKPRNTEDIEEKVLLIANRMTDMKSDCIWAAKQFGWDEIASKYVKLYAKGIKRN